MSLFFSNFFFHLSNFYLSFFDSLPRLGEVGYLPTLKDILHTRVRSTGMEEVHLSFRRGDVIVVDTGGERSERRKCNIIFFFQKHF